MTHSTRTAGRRGARGALRRVVRRRRLERFRAHLADAPRGGRGRRPRGAAFGSEARVVLLVACPAPGPGCCQEVALAD